MDDLLETLKSAEVALHQLSVRRDTSQVQALLHEPFLEFGRSGARYDRDSILSLLASEEPGDGPILSQDFALTPLGTSAALLTYRSAVVDDSGEIRRHSLRASIWIRTPDGWKLRFHQGTPTEAFKISTDNGQSRK